MLNDIWLGNSYAELFRRDNFNLWLFRVIAELVYLIILGELSYFDGEGFSCGIRLLLSSNYLKFKEVLFRNLL